MITAGHNRGIEFSEIANVLAERLPSLPVRQRLLMPMALFGGKVIITTSFGPTSAVLLHLASNASPGVTVLNVRHGHETAETLAFMEQCEKCFPISLVSARAPDMPVPETGSGAFDEFQQVTKVRPLRDALSDLGAWFWLSGVMHDETETRRAMKMARVRHGAVAIYPILDWTSEQALEYCISNDLPVNNNYFDPCKGPDQSLECGLHHDSGHIKP